jgi:hypothetical protein
MVKPVGQFRRAFSLRGTKRATKKRSQSPASSVVEIPAGSSAVGKSIDMSLLAYECDGSTTVLSQPRAAMFAPIAGAV